MGITSRAVGSSSHPTITTIKINLTNFAEAMGKSKSISEDVGVAQQATLLSTIKLLFKMEGDDFNDGMKVFEDWVKSEIDKSMSLSARYRFLHLAKRISKIDQSAMMIFIGLLAMTADDAARQQVLGRFDLSRIDRFWSHIGASDKLANYYATR